MQTLVAVGVALAISIACVWLFWSARDRASPSSGKHRNFPMVAVPALSRRVVCLDGDGSYDYEIVGESKYQEALRAIAGVSDVSAEFECEATLAAEPLNTFDPKAIRVQINGKTVGYIPQDDTADFHQVLRGGTGVCDALIVGGWDRGERDRGHFGVRLDIDWPPSI